MRVLVSGFARRSETVSLQFGSCEVVSAGSARELIAQMAATDIDAVIIDGSDLGNVYLALAYFAVLPWRRKPLVVVDLVLRRPSGLRQRLALPIARAAFSRVDHFLHYFKDLSRYAEVFGIPPERSSYVPFKSNVLGTAEAATVDIEGAGEYVFTMGVSMRDYDTFFEAVARLPYPVAISQFSYERFHRETGRWGPNQLPPNVRCVAQDGGRADLVRNMAAARLVVVPISPESLCCSGISTYLDAMALKRCVIITEGPGVSELLQGRAILVPAGDPKALARAITLAWEDESLRMRVAAQGRRYAVELGDETMLLRRILTATKLYLDGRTT